MEPRRPRLGLEKIPGADHDDELLPSQNQSLATVSQARNQRETSANQARNNREKSAKINPLRQT